MAPIESPPQYIPNRRALAAWPNALAALYVALLFVALRAVDDEQLRNILLGSAALTYVAMIAGRLRGRASADVEGRRLLLLVGGPADALLLLGGALSAWFVLGDDVNELIVGAGVLALVAGAAITLALELVIAPMRATGAVDNRRVQAAGRTAGTLVAAIAAVAGLCYGVEKLDVRRDFSFAAPTSPSQATLSLLEASSCAAPAAQDGAGADASNAPLGEKPEVFLFFERGSTALGEVRDYFDALQHAGARVTTMDSAADPVLAKDMKVSKNGTVGFRCGKRTESWTLGDTREDAQKKLTKVDEEVRTRLAKISKDAVTVYVTVGHGERSLDESAKGGGKTSAKGLKKLIESLNAKTKKLGVSDGLTQEVPKDAALVIIPGPTSAFLPEEVTSLMNYVAGGGSLMLLLDPKLPTPDAVDVTQSLEPLLAALAVRVGSHEVMNDKAYVKNTGTNVDWAFVYSTSFGSHKSVKTLSGARGKANLLLMGAANVQKRDEVKGPKVSLTARTPADSWVDANDNRAYDKDSEARAVVDVAAAVELDVPGGKDGKAEGAPASAGQGRAWVIGDADCMSDLLIAHDANSVFAYEGLLWLLRDDDKLGGGVQSEEDVPIRHTRDEDTLWFYGTVFFGPLLCMVLGLAFVSRRRHRGRADALPLVEPRPPSAPSSTGGAP